MKLSAKELLKLQKHWYELLASSGYDDIEHFVKDRLELKKSVMYPFKHTDFERMLIQEEYFRLLGIKVNDEDTYFKSEVDRYILTRHAEGIKSNVIAFELQERGTPKHRHSIRFIIRRYEFQWGIKSYNLRQLNKKVS